MSDLKQNRWEPASPSTTPHYSWKGRRRHEAISIVQRWEKKYPTETVRLFVEDALSVTRSPGKIEVYKAWLNEHPTQSRKYGKLLIELWADKALEQLKSSMNGLRAIEWEMNYLSNGSVTEYGGLVGDKMSVPATSLNESPGQREILEALGCPVPHPAQVTAFYHQFTDNPEQPSGIIEFVVDEAMVQEPDAGFDRFMREVYPKYLPTSSLPPMPKLPEDEIDREFERGCYEPDVPTLPDTCYDCDTRPTCCKEYQEEGD